MPLSIVILAAGQGKRMKSDLPKVLQPLAGRPILSHVLEAAKSAANTDRMEAVTRSLARVHGEGAAAAMKAVEAIKQVGYTTDDAQGAVQKLIKADMSLAHAEGLAKVAKDAAALNTEGLGAAEALD